MALRSQKAVGIAIALWLSQAAVRAQVYEFPAEHGHWRKGCRGTLRIGEGGISFEAAAAKAGRNRHAWNWTWKDIQQLELSPGKVRVLTYIDSAWKLGADRQYEFEALGGRRFSEAYPWLKGRLDRRFVAALADDEVKPLWEVSAKLLGRTGGSHGVLLAGQDRIVYKTGKEGESRTWRLSDIDNIARAGLFDLTLTTFERAQFHYGSQRSFNFQLKEPLSEERYDDLWRRINRSRGSELQ